MDLDDVPLAAHRRRPALLIEAAATAYADHDGDPVGAATALRGAAARPDARPAAAALTQVQLRVRAVPKFGERRAADVLHPRRARAGDPATGSPSTGRPGWWPRDVGSVIDLGCGIGGDLVAFARAGLTTAGIDPDPVRVAIASANLAALGLGGRGAGRGRHHARPRRFGAAFADPARRSGRGRVFDAEGWTPPWPFVAGLLGAAAPPSVVKVAPGIPHSLVPDDVEAEWVSVRGEVKEAALWSPGLATCRRRATVIGTGGLATLTEEDDPYDGQPRPVRELGAYLYEPDGAVIRAGLVTAVAAGVQGGLPDPHIAYVTSDMGFRSPFARAYRIVEELPYREKQLKAALRARDIGRLTVKKRGVEIDPAALRRRLALSGASEATLVLTRRSGTGIALLVKPL